MFIFLDESGDTASAKGFAVTLFFTRQAYYWQRILGRIRREEKYPYELKFHKISANPRDGRFRVTDKLFDALARESGTFWCRSIVVDRAQFRNKKFFKRGPQVEYDHFVELIVLHYTRKIPEAATLAIDRRHRSGERGFIPGDLQQDLTARAFLEGMPAVTIEDRDSKEEPLLQVADLIGGAIHQHHFPSKNRQKRLLAQKLSALFGVSIYVWKWDPGKRKEPFREEGAQ